MVLWMRVYGVSLATLALDGRQCQNLEFQLFLALGATQNCHLPSTLSVWLKIDNRIEDSFRYG